jgi:hypothetical protein
MQKIRKRIGERRAAERLALKRRNIPASPAGKSCLKARDADTGRCAPNPDAAQPAGASVLVAGEKGAKPIQKIGFSY